MNRSKKLALAGIICLCCTNACFARLIEHWPYAKLKKRSDLVVIAEAVQVEDTKDTLLSTPWKDEIEWAGRNTVFRIKFVIKGEPKSEQIKVLHFRIKESKRVVLKGGPLLAEFEKKREYILFLKNRMDGRFEMVSGQIDPILAVREISPPKWGY